MTTAPVGERNCDGCRVPLAGQAAYFSGHGFSSPLCGGCALEAGYQRYAEYPFRQGALLSKDEWLTQYANARLPAAKPCEVCGHGVAWLVYRRRSRAHVCSYDCDTERRNRRRRIVRDPSVCPVCGEPFTPARSDAVTCSARCRQRLRRSRLSVEGIRVTDSRDSKGDD
ncbi:MAG: hypothetical protein ACR2ND_00855 [Solirubrobacteraceae bacterium]